ncbi:MAG: VWA domain-containing protein [Clostridia bacterium]|nr:VWA domain-containing protein [Clostridia bacterium]
MKKRTSGKWISRLFVLLLSLVLITAGFGRNVLAEENNDFDVSGSKTASPTELKGDERETTVTLSLPSAEYQNKVDIVFVMDSSSSTDLGTQFIESANALFESIVENNQGVDLKVGIVLFTGSANDAVKYVSNGSYSELTEYNDDTKSLFEQSFHISETLTKNEFRNTFGRGSAPHCGLDLANVWLENDSEVEDSNKYVVLFTDGKGYIWANEAHEPTTIYSQYYTNNKYALASGGLPVLNQVMGYNKGAYSVDVLDPSGKSNIYTFSTYEELYNSTDEELTGVTKWDQPCPYAFGDTWEQGTPTGSVVKHTVSNGAALFGAGGTFGNRNDYQYWYECSLTGSWTDLVYQEANPYMIIDNGDGTYTFDTETVNPNYYQYHVDCLQKGIYKAGHLWTEMGEKYNCGVITYDSSTGGGLELVGPFKEWLRTNSQYGANKTNASEVAALFNNIDNDIRYMVGSGTVTDEIADEFDLKVPEDGSSPFKLTYKGEELTAAADGENKWVFGEAADGVYPYIVEYDPDANSFVWTLNVPIENVNPVTLSYDLILKDEFAIDGNSYDTNKSAVLDYVSTDGKYEGTFTFEVPVVKYTNPPEKNPQTGDTGRIMIFSAVALLTAVGAVTAAAVIRKKDHAA